MTREEKKSYKMFMAVIGFTMVALLFAGIYVLIDKLKFLEHARVVKARIDKATFKGGQHVYDISFESDQHENRYEIKSGLELQEGYYVEVYLLQKDRGLSEIELSVNFYDVYGILGSAFVLTIIFIWSYFFPEKVVDLSRT